MKLISNKDDRVTLQFSATDFETLTCFLLKYSTYPSVNKLRKNINYVLELDQIKNDLTAFKCTVCGELFDMQQLRKGSLSAIGTGRCKPCHSQIVCRKKIEADYKKRPSRFHVCYGCGHIWSKNTIKYKAHCPKCGDEIK